MLKKWIVKFVEKRLETFEDDMMKWVEGVNKKVEIWIAEADHKHREDSERMDDVRAANLKHMRVVEEYIATQNKILVEIKEALTLLSERSVPKKSRSEGRDR